MRKRRIRGAPGRPARFNGIRSRSHPPTEPRALRSRCVRHFRSTPPLRTRANMDQHRNTRSHPHLRGHTRRPCRNRPATLRDRKIRCSMRLRCTAGDDEYRCGRTLFIQRSAIGHSPSRIRRDTHPPCRPRWGSQRSSEIPCARTRSTRMPPHCTTPSKARTTARHRGYSRSPCRIPPLQRKIRCGRT